MTLLAFRPPTSLPLLATTLRTCRDCYTRTIEGPLQIDSFLALVRAGTFLLVITCVTVETLLWQAWRDTRRSSPTTRPSPAFSSSLTPPSRIRMNNSERVPCHFLYILQVQNSLNIGQCHCFKLNKDGTRAALSFSKGWTASARSTESSLKDFLVSKILCSSASGGYSCLFILLWLESRVMRQPFIHLHISNSVDCE